LDLTYAVRERGAKNVVPLYAKKRLMLSASGLTNVALVYWNLFSPMRKAVGSAGMESSIYFESMWLLP
jgi:hypothetical protein